MAPTVHPLRHALFAGSMFVYFGVGSALLSYVILPWQTRGIADEARRARRAHRTIAAGFTQFYDLIRAFGLGDFDPRDARLDLPDGPCVIVSNHPTLIDVITITSVIGSACTVVRANLFDRPGIAPLLRLAWHIRAADGGAMPGAAVVQGALDRLARGMRVLIFPEGTRSPAGGLRRFRRGAFEIACRADVPLVLVWVGCTPPTLMKGVPWYALPKRRVRITVETLATLHPRDFDGDPRRLMAHAKSLYRERLARWRDAHPDDVPAAPAPDDEG